MLHAVAQPAKAHAIELLEGARALFPALVAAIDGARVEVALETYIFDPTGAGASVAEALIRAASRGVITRVVVDAIGTGDCLVPWLQRFEQAGVRLRRYRPLGWFGWLAPSRWRRLHRKLCVIDGVTAFCGGINILDDWYDPSWGRLTNPRLDFSVHVRGELAAEIQTATTRLWQRMKVADGGLDGTGHASRPNALQRSEQAPTSKASASGRPAAAADRRARPSGQSALLLGDNLRNRHKIERAYRRAIGAARHEIVIASAYFLPGRKLRRALLHAARRGVRVQLLLQGRYEYFLQFHGVRPAYRKLLESGVEIYEYAPSFLHAKVAVIDADGMRPWATVGSSNLDPLSLLMAREANVVVEARRFCQHLRKRLNEAMQQEGRRVDLAALATLPWRERLLDRVASLLMRVGLLLTGQFRY
ncbi:MAG: cardiolipin synthase ClsB [Burkholderiaceae bacterium]